MLARVLRSDFAWRLSGLTYPSAVIATHGTLVGVDRYLRECDRQMESLREYFHGNERALELGCGLGGNVLSIAARGVHCVGVDINPLFIAWARFIARSRHAQDAEFRTIRDASTSGDRFDSLFSIGVFERLSREEVRASLSYLTSLAKPGARFFLYFLAPRARQSRFVDRLGESAYVYWVREDIIKLLAGVDIVPAAWYGWGPEGLSLDTSSGIAEFVVATAARP